MSVVVAPSFWRPEDLPAWRAWQRAQWPASRRAADRARAVLGAVRGATAPDAGLRLLLPPGDVHTLVALESAGPTQRAALVAPVEALTAGRSGHPDDAARRLLDGVAWVAPAAVADALRPELPGAAGLTAADVTPGMVAGRLSGLRRVLVAGEYLPAGRAAVRWGRERGAETAVVQHGLLAVSTPPVPRDATLYAFTDQDGAWWTQGRADVRAAAMGSALLEQARRTAMPAAGAGRPDIDRLDIDRAGVGRRDVEGPGVFLGQLHGAELPRRDFVAAAEQYVRATGAVYRPHPAERDRLSRAQHARWEAAGVPVDRSGAPLTQTSGPVAAVFSTGILEAAQAGRPAWGVHPDPPRWLEQFWDRYGIARWRPGADTAPTPPLVAPTPDPAAAIAEDFWKDQA